MFSFIRRLQQKPEPQRRAIAFGTALFVTACIFVLWLVSFFVRMDSTAVPQQQQEKVSPVESLSEMISSFSALFKDQF